MTCCCFFLHKDADIILGSFWCTCLSSFYKVMSPYHDALFQITIYLPSSGNFFFFFFLKLPLSASFHFHFTPPSLHLYLCVHEWIIAVLNACSSWSLRVQLFHVYFKLVRLYITYSLLCPWNTVKNRTVCKSVKWGYVCICTPNVCVCVCWKRCSTPSATGLGSAYLQCECVASLSCVRSVTVHCKWMYGKLLCTSSVQGFLW